MDKISLVILSPLDIPLEKFIWDVSSLPRIPAVDIDSPYRAPREKGVDWRIENAEIERQSLEDSLRAALIRTAFSDAKLSTLPEGCSFTLTIEVREETDRPGGNVTPLPLSIGDFGVKRLMVGIYVALDAGG